MEYSVAENLRSQVVNLPPLNAHAIDSSGIVMNYHVQSGIVTGSYSQFHTTTRRNGQNELSDSNLSRKSSRCALNRGLLAECKRPR